MRRSDVGLLFMIPGVEVTLRINGHARISTDPGLLARLAFEGKQPTTVIVVAVDQVYLQCAKALIRSQLWSDASRVDPSSLPSPRRMLYEQISDEPDEDEIRRAEAEYDQHNQRTLY